MRRLKAAALIVVALAPGLAQGQQDSTFTSATIPQVRQAPAIRPLNGFVENKGQWPDEVLFFARYGRIELTLLPDALVFRPQPDRETGEWPAPLVLRLPHAVEATGEGALPTQHNFLLGSIRVSHAQGFERVVYHDVVPGLDLVVHVGAEGFEYDLNAAPGVDVSALTLQVEGASGLTIEDGALVMQTGAGRVEQRIGAAWQTDASGGQVPVPSRFRIAASADGMASFGFEAPGRDLSRALVLDPSLAWSTYVGGSGQELVQDIAVTTDGSVYIAVKSSSATPSTPGAFQTVKLGVNDAWVGMLSADGSVLEWGTFLGGTNTEAVVGVRVDQDGTVVVLGDTWSTDFPVTAGGIQRGFGGQNDMFLSRLTPDGSTLLWSTFYGGPQNDHASALAMFPTGDVLIAGYFDVPGPAATPGAYDSVFNANDHILARISADGTKTIFLTYFHAAIYGMVCDDQLGIIFGGTADAASPTTPGAFQGALAPGDPGSAYVAKLDASGSHLEWATYLGGANLSEYVHSVAVDAAGAVYVAGQTLSNDFPVTPGAFDLTSTNDGGDGFVAKLLPGGTGLVWSTYLSACCGGATLQWDIAVDSAGNAISAGASNEPNFPTTPDALQPTYIGGFPAGDGHITKFDAFGETLVYSTYFGGGSSEQQPAIGLDGAQDPVIALNSSSGNIPITPGAYDTSYAGGTDTVVAKFDLTLLPWKVMGGGLAGAKDIPNLAGGGSLLPGTPARLSVRGAAASAPASLVAGLSPANLAFKGGTLVPLPSLIVTLATNAQGALDLPFTLTNVPAGIAIWVQFWIKDAGAPKGFAATNALKMITQ